MSNDAPASSVPSGLPKRKRAVLKMVAGATTLAGLVAVGIGAIPSALLRPEAKTVREDPHSSPQQQDSRPADPISAIMTSMSTETSEEPDPYAAVQGCILTISYRSTPQVSSVVPTKASPAEPKD
jgi:hypothetical protein